MSEYTQGVMEDGAAILKDGELMTIDEIVKELNTRQQPSEWVSVAVGLLDAAECPRCDKSGAYYDNMGDVCQCQWCYEVSELKKLLPQPPKDK